eukprot:scaffold7118_cov30-Phaeocystis_antarctica.AAC.1
MPRHWRCARTWSGPRLGLGLGRVRVRARAGARARVRHRVSGATRARPTGRCGSRGSSQPRVPPTTSP